MNLMTAFICIISLCEAFPFSKEVVKRDKKTAFRGLSETEFREMELCMKYLKSDIAKSKGHLIDVTQVPDTLLGDIAVTAKQCYDISEIYKSRDTQIIHDDDQGESRRSVVGNNVLKWKFPIYYRIDTNNFTQEQQDQIRDAVRVWEGSTCLRFTEVFGTTVTPRLEITSDFGCWSYVGHISDIQLLNLEPHSCTNRPGIIQHEIGHAVGLYHEQSRIDRDDFVIVYYDKIQIGYESNFAIDYSSVNQSVPYNYGSVMHYTRYDFAKVVGDNVLEAIDPDFSYAMGQPVGVSFLDFTMINRLYQCASYEEVCMSSNLTCHNGGYPNPGTPALCSTCLCPSGLGSDCSTAATGSAGCDPLSGDLTATTEEQCVTSPDYMTGGPYTAGSTCSWLITAAQSDKLVFVRFDKPDSAEFGVYHFSAGNGTCYHWVEIKHRGNLTEPGARICGSNGHIYNQGDTFTSVTNEMLVHFDGTYSSFDTVMYASRMRGFKLCYRQVDTPVTTTPSTTVTTTTISTTTTEQPAPIVQDSVCLHYNRKGTKCVSWS